MNDYWKVLLEKQQERGKKGFTLPFLIGSQTYLPTEHSFQNISEIIVDMATNNSFETCIRYCTDTCALIFEIRNPNNAVTFPKFQNAEQKNLSIATRNNDLGNSIQEVIESLKEEYQDKIDAEQYSAESDNHCREATWTNFTTSDIKFIEECFESLE